MPDGLPMPVPCPSLQAAPYGISPGPGLADGRLLLRSAPRRQMPGPELQEGEQFNAGFHIFVPSLAVRAEHRRPLRLF